MMYVQQRLEMASRLQHFKLKAPERVENQQNMEYNNNRAILNHHPQK